MAVTNGRLQGKVAIVTGGATGIGEAIAHKFVREGARVTLAGLPGDPLDDVARALRARGGEVVVYEGDLGEEEHAAACVEATVDQFGKLDVLVNNAGVFPEVNETQDFSIAGFERLIHNNVRTVFLMTRAALPHLHKSRGVVLSAGSESGWLGLAKVTSYGGTKGWIHAFMEGVAVEQAQHGVRANCVCPGPIDTAWTHKETGPMDEQMEEMNIQATPLGRLGTPEEVANVYAFLASDEASYVTGALWFVDGGITVAKGGVGGQVPDELQRQPEGELELAHSLDGRAG